MTKNKNKTLIGGAQIRAARALLDWTATDLAEASGVARMTVQCFERQQGAPAFAKNTLMLVRAALEGAGVEFYGDLNCGPGVRLLSRTRGRS